MFKRVKDLWVKALESGNFKQTKGKMIRGKGNQTSYCCLGVLARVYAKEHGISLKKGVVPVIKDLSEVGGDMPSDKVKNWAGITEADCDVLVILNDGGSKYSVEKAKTMPLKRHNFKEIAAHIRKEL